jgi:hypothetical protein
LITKMLKICGHFSALKNSGSVCLILVHAPSASS